MARSLELPKPGLVLDVPKPPKPGGGGWPLFVDRVEPWAWQEGWFTPDELDAIIALGEAEELDPGYTGGGLNPTQRDSHVRFIFPNEDSHWLFAKMAGLINGMNDMWFGFDLSSMEQGLQYTRYSAETKQHYDWHVDRGGNTGTRKLSISVQLSDPDDYEGGDLEFSFGGKDPVVQPKVRGRAVAFPSWTMHRVAPVTKGVRRSLVVWVSGPPFK